MQGEFIDKINADRQVIHCIYELLPTVEEALYCIVDHLNQLELEKAGVVFSDVCDAVQKISANLLLLQIEEQEDFLLALQQLRTAIGFATDYYEDGHLIEMKDMVDNFMIPYYDGWREEVLLLLSGRQFAYLQN